MKITILSTLLLTFFFCELFYAQDDIQIGIPYGSAGVAAQGGLYNYSDPTNVNIKVQLWGYVKFPGYYIVPAGVSINELISLAGGPTEDAILNDIRVIKIREGSETAMMKYNYNDFMWEGNIKSEINYTRLDAGDVVVVPGEPRYFVREDVVFYLSVVTTLATLALLIITIININ